MDPVTIIGLVEGSISLAVQCGSVAKSLNNIAGQYKHAKLTLSTMVQNLEIMQLTWDRIAVWSKDHVFTDSDSLKGRLERFLETGFLVLNALEEDLKSYNASKLTFHQRSRLVWNNGTLEAHQTRIRDQAQSMSLFLQAVQLPTIQGTAELLQQSREQFIKSDESAFSIVPSRMSSRLSLPTIQTDDRVSVRSSASLEYRRFSFENDLFTVRVYKRNYRTVKYQGSRKQEPGPDSKAVESRKGDLQSSEPAGASILDRKSTIRDRNTSTDQQYGDFVAACRKGDKDEVSKVLKTSSIYGGTVTSNRLFSRKCDSMHLCPIHAAVYGGHLGVMETLLQHDHLEHNGSLGSLLFCTGTYMMVHGHKQRSVPPLHFAAYKRDFPMVQLLLTMGAPINAESDYGVQAIHLAAKIGSITFLTVLIAAGASVNCRDYKGRQPMHYLSEKEQPEVIQYLAEKGAEIDGISDTSQITPLGFACKHGIHANAKALLSLGALVTSPILDSAVEDGPSFMVETLLRFAESQKQGQTVVLASLRRFLSTLLQKQSAVVDEDREKLRLLIEYTRYLGKDQDGDAFLYRLFLRLSLPETREVPGPKEDFSKHFLSDLTSFGNDGIESSVRRERQEKDLLAGLERDSTSATVLSDLIFQCSQKKEARSENPEKGSTVASAPPDIPREHGPSSSIRHVHSTSVDISSTEAAMPREPKASDAFFDHTANHLTD